MLNWLRCFIALGIIWMSGATTPPRLEAQEATITINGYGYGQIAGVGHECPMRKVGDKWKLDGYVGFQVSCPVWGLAADSTFTPASMSVIVANPTMVAATIIHSVADSIFHPDTLRVQILRQGNWSIDLKANPILFIMGYAYTRTPDAIWPQHEYPPMNVVGGETFVLCAYEGGYENAVAKSLARPTPCPDLGGHPLPEFGVEWILPDILGPVNPSAVPGSIMAQLERNFGELRVKHLEDTLHGVPVRATGATN